MGLLAFLAAGQTHKTEGPYRGNIAAAINWLIRQQEANGNLAKNCVQPMYSHGLATIALCEAYGLSGDKNIGVAAERAVSYIIDAQNQGTGGWRYTPASRATRPSSAGRSWP
jgi:squalene cyclase